jgi:hypothetical protein
MTGSLFVTTADPEARDRAVHGMLGRVVRPDAELRGDAGTERLEHDVGPLEQRTRERALAR